MVGANRISNLPPYLFAEIDKKIAKKRAAGEDVISLGIGDPDQPTPAHIIARMEQEIKNPANHRYPSYYGMPAFREAISRWYKDRFNVDLDPDNEVLPLIGSKEGIAHIALALLDQGDTSLVADPGYPVYNTGTILAGAIPVFMPLLAENGFLPELDRIDADAAQAAKVMFLNYPNNPTAAIADSGFFSGLIDYAKQHDIVVAHDFPYSEIVFDGYVATSFLELPGAKDVGVEFHSLSKTYNMTGWRIGWVAGNKDVIEALSRVKTNIDSGIFNAVQYAGIEALTGPQDCVQTMCDIYQRRRDIVVDGLNAIGWNISKPKASIYVWCQVPEGYTSASFAEHVLERAAVVISPGNAYGPSGEGYFRISLSVADDRILEALERIKSVL